MKIITCQHEWIEQCQMRYRVEPPLGYRFEDAHYPEPECRNGTETIRLWYPDHIVHGALQTLDLQHPCMNGKRVPAERHVLQDVYPEYLEIFEKAYRFCQTYAGVRGASKTHAEKDEIGRSLHTLQLHEKKDEFGRSKHAVNTLLKVHNEKDEFGRSINAVQNIAKCHEKKDELGRSVQGVKNAEKMHEEKDELGRSVQGVKNAGRTNKQIWESTKDGFRSHSGGVALHNKANGWDPGARIKIS